MKKTKMYTGHRYPSQIISHTVWLYFRFTLSFRDIEELLAARGIAVSYETIRQLYPKQSLRSWGRLCPEFDVRRRIRDLIHASSTS